MKITTYFIVFLLSVICIVNAQAQATGSINVIGGSSVGFHVNSLTKYDQGVTLEGWSRVRLRFNDPDAIPLTTGWRLMVRAETATIVSDNSVDELPLNSIQIRAVNIEDNGGNYTGPATAGPIILNSSYVEILSDNQNINVDVIVTLSYDLGTEIGNKLMGSEPGYYFVDLRYQLISY